MKSLKEQLEQFFIQEAQPKLPQEKIQKIINTEHTLIQTSQQKNIPVSLWMGYNTRRYCKDLLRSQQPGFWLYQLINYIAESSCVLLFFSLILWGLDNLTSLEKHSAVYLFLPLTFILPLWKILFAIYCKRKIVTSSNKTIQICRLISLVLATIAGITGAFCLRKQIWDFAHHLSLLSAFLFYVAMMLLSGIHNVLYQSSFVDFFCVGIAALRRDNTKLELHINQYLTHKKSKEQALGSMISTRIYLFLAIVIILALTITGGYQYYLHQDFSLGIFVLLSFVVLCIFLHCLMCACILVKGLKS